MKKQFERSGLKALIGGLALAALVHAGSAVAQVSMKFHHDLPEDSAQHLAAEKFKAAVEAAIIPTAKLSNFVPAMQIVDLPFLFPSPAITHKVLDDAAGGG